MDFRGKNVSNLFKTRNILKSTIEQRLLKNALKNMIFLFFFIWKGPVRELIIQPPKTNLSTILNYSKAIKDFRWLDERKIFEITWLLFWYQSKGPWVKTDLESLNISFELSIFSNMLTKQNCSNCIICRFLGYLFCS